MLINTVCNWHELRRIDTLPASGSELVPDVMYKIYDAVDNYTFTAPSTGWTHGFFRTGDEANISFSPNRFVGSAPPIQTQTEYEFDVLDGVWVVSVLSE